MLYAHSLFNLAQKIQDSSFIVYDINTFPIGVTYNINIGIDMILSALSQKGVNLMRNKNDSTPIILPFLYRRLS